MIWQAEAEELDAATLRLGFRDGGGLLDYGAVLAGWRGDGGFRDAFSEALAAAPYTAFLWETPPITARTLGRPFECVAIDSPALAAMTPEPEAFAAHFGGAAVADFANLGGDAHLVAPAPAGGSYPHLAAFLRGAPSTQRQALWQRVGAAAAARLSERPLWISSCGLGVAWLHVRLDQRPKYYRYGPYRTP